MIYIWKCLICGQTFKCNGQYAQKDLKREHLKEFHIEKYNELLTMFKQITNIEDKIREIKNGIWCKIE